MATTASPDTLALQRLYHWESTAPDRVALTQPLGALVLALFVFGLATGHSLKKSADSGTKG